jgi:hypothetical protein
VIGWVAWPYYAAYRLAVAVWDGDVPTLESAVAWGSVRNGLRDDLNAALLQKLAENAKNKKSEPGTALGAGLAVRLGPAIIDRMVNSYVTPQAIATMSRANRADQPTDQAAIAAPTSFSDAVRSARRIRWQQVRYAFFSGGPLTFRVDFTPEQNGANPSPLGLIFKWDGDWKLTRVDFPPDAIGGITAAAKDQDNPASPLSAIAPPSPSPATVAATTTIPKQQAPVEVRLLEKGFKSRDIQAREYDDYITIELTVKNVTDKDIRAFDGILTFTDLLDNEIFSSKLAINDAVKALSTMTWMRPVCAQRDAMKRVIESVDGAELTRPTLIWTRGRDSRSSAD